MNLYSQLTSLILYAFLVGINIIPILEQVPSPTTQKNDETLVPPVSLRDVYIGRETQPTGQVFVVGRLGILLRSQDGYKLVRHQHVFSSGDRFRFQITSNKGGRLYVLHASPGGLPKQLWPMDEQTFAIEAGRSYDIPPEPGIFVFDKEVGEELFYVAIRLDGKLPQLSGTARVEDATAKKPAIATQDAKGSKSTVVNFRIRNPFGDSARGVTFDPGTNDEDPYIYFSAVPKDGTDKAMIEFQLQHAQ